MYGEIPLEYYSEQDREVPSNSYCAGIDFDPSDPEEVESVMLASEWDAHNRIVKLERENAELRSLLRGDEDQDYYTPDPWD